MKILVVGAGPVGCYTAQLLKQNGFADVTVLEEHAEIGRPVHCAGLVSAQVLDEMRFPLPQDIVLNRIDGAQFFLNGESFTIKRDKVAVVIDREKFDRALGEGLQVRCNTRFMGLEREGEGYLVETEEGEFYADIVIGANGASSSLRKAMGMKEQVEILRGVQFRIRHEECIRQYVEVYLKKHFFAWIIPEHPGVARVGIISDNPYHDLLDFMKEKNISASEVLEKYGGVVPVGECQTQKEKVFLVGDAACQMKPLTYGGIYYGMRCAEILVECIAQGAYDEYDRRWRQRFDHEIKTTLKIKKIYSCLSPDNIAGIFRFFKKNSALLEQYGDFENHSRTLSLIFSKTKLPMFMARMLLGILKDIHF